MKYILRPGVVRTSVCRIPFLIPDREAWEHCPYVQSISLPGAALIACIQNGESFDKAYNVCRILTRRTPEEARRRIDELAASLCEKGFLIAVEDET